MDSYLGSVDSITGTASMALNRWGSYTRWQEVESNVKSRVAGWSKGERARGRLAVVNDSTGDMMQLVTRGRGRQAGDGQEETPSSSSDLWDWRVVEPLFIE